MHVATLQLLGETYAICRLEGGSALPPELPVRDRLLSVTSTPAEVSIVCREEHAPAGARTETGWRAMEVEGPLDFALTGVLAGLTAPLAEADVRVFAVSTYDTDYILVRTQQLASAIRALNAAEHHIVMA